MKYYIQRQLNEYGPYTLLTIGGSLGREEATARGALFCIRDAVAKRDGRLDGMTVAVQGFGNVGSYLAKFLHEEGASVVAISDSRAALYNAKGIDIAAAFAHKREHGTLAGLKDADQITNDELLLLDVDILAPCALEQVITERTPTRSRRRSSAKAANGPVTPAADAILEDKGVLILPDVLANAGGVVVSYFEWVQGLQEYFWKETEVNAKLNDIMSRAFEETWETAEQRHCRCASPRTASPCSASPRRRSRVASTRKPDVAVFHSAGVISASARSSRCGRCATSSSSSCARSTSPATRRSRRSTATGCRWSRSTAAGASRTTSSPTRSAVRLHKQRPSRSC